MKVEFEARNQLSDRQKNGIQQLRSAVEQPTSKIEFSAYNTMILDVKEKAPVSGSLDLNGLPW